MPSHVHMPMLRAHVPVRIHPSHARTRARMQVSLRGWKGTEHEESRVLLLAGWLRCKPASLVSIDLRETALTCEEASAIASSVNCCPKLVTLNVLSNESMGVEGAASFVKALEASPTLRSLCGISPTANGLEVPRRSLSAIDATLIAAELTSTNWGEQLGAAENKAAPVSKLVRRGERAAASFGERWHPLIWAAKEGNPPLVQALLSRGLDVNLNEDENANAGFTALMWAAYRGHAPTCATGGLRPHRAPGACACARPRARLRSHAHTWACTPPACAGATCCSTAAPTRASRTTPGAPRPRSRR